MSITNIRRDWGVGPSMVRITTTDTITTCLQIGYLTTQIQIISLINNGPFQFVMGDLLSIYASDGTFIAVFLDNNFSTIYPLASGNTDLIDYFSRSSAGTFQYTAPDGTDYIQFYAIAGGGGGGGFADGGGASTFGAAGGGGSGASFQGTLSVRGGSGWSLPTLSFPITIGAGGIGGAAGANGSPGGSTSFNYLGGPSAAGGSGGVGVKGIANSASLFAAGGLGGVGVSGTIPQISSPGYIGDTGMTSQGQVASGKGGGTVYCEGGRGLVNANLAGGNAAFGGAGGGGACGTSAGTLSGGNGAAGIIIIFAYGTYNY